MTVQKISGVHHYVGLSTDSKPLPENIGSTFLEEDTGLLFKYGAGGWFFNGVALVGSDGDPVDVNNPLPTDGDSVYPKDIDVLLSSIGTFDDGESTDILDLFRDIPLSLADNSSNNPKSFTFTFKRPVEATQIGMGCATGNFSNVKILLKDLAGVVRGEVDDSANDTKHTAFVYKFPSPVAFGAITVEFHTPDPVCIGYIFLQKDVRSISRLQAQDEVSGEVEDIKSFNGAINTHNADVHQISLNRHFIQRDTASTNPNVAVSQDDINIQVDDTTGFANGDFFLIQEGSVEETDAVKIITVTPGTPGTFALDRPVDNDYTIAATIERVVRDMSTVVVATPASPVVFTIAPLPGEIFHFLRLNISMTHQQAGNDSTFGSLPALTNGIILRQNLSTRKEIISNWKTNGDIRKDVGVDLVATTGAGLAANGTSARFTFKRADFVVALIGDNGDSLDIIIQDPLSGLNTCEMKAQGHFVGL